jgi:hypothetical protein
VLNINACKNRFNPDGFIPNLFKEKNDFLTFEKLPIKKSFSFIFFELNS